MAQAAEQDTAAAGRSGFERRPAPADNGRAHRAAIVASDEEILASALPYLDEGLRAGDLVVLSCAPDTAGLITGALGERAGAVESDARVALVDTAVPDAVAATWTLMRRAEETGSGRLRVAGQVRFGAEPRSWREGLRYEAAVNVLLAARPVTALCLFDRRVLPAEVLAGAVATHPEILSGGSPAAGSEFQEPADFVRRLPLPREPVEDAAPVLAVDDVRSLVELRRALRAAIDARVPDPDQSADLQFAVSEIAANAFRHGARPVSARVWADADRLVCTVTDRGRGYDVPFAGFRPARGDDLGQGGMGLWLARKLFDHVDLLAATPGLTVRLSSRLR